MEQERKARWVEALRSGEYVQGLNYLRTQQRGTPDRFCCLGVLCDISPDLGHWDDQPKGSYSERFVFNDGESSCYDLGKGDILGLSEDDQSKLTHRNDGDSSSKFNPDGERLTFEQIADYIEENIS